MIAADTNIWIAFLNGKKSKFTDLLASYLEQGLVIMPPVVMCGEITEETSLYLSAVPIIEINDSFWFRASKMRKQLLKNKFKSHTADCLIAQSCIDIHCMFLTEDKDFRHYVPFGLILQS